jgi:hypothetical protein
MREKRVSIIYPRIPFYLGPILMGPIPKRKSLSLGRINFREAFHRSQPFTAADIFPRKGATYPALQLFVAFCRFSALPLFDQPRALPFRGAIPISSPQSGIPRRQDEGPFFSHPR